VHHGVAPLVGIDEGAYRPDLGATAVQNKKFRSVFEADGNRVALCDFLDSKK